MSQTTKGGESDPPKPSPIIDKPLADERSAAGIQRPSILIVAVRTPAWQAPLSRRVRKRPVTQRLVGSQGRGGRRQREDRPAEDGSGEQTEGSKPIDQDADRELHHRVANDERAEGGSDLRVGEPGLGLDLLRDDAHREAGGEGVRGYNEEEGRKGPTIARGRRRRGQSVQCTVRAIMGSFDHVSQL